MGFRSSATNAILEGESRAATQGKLLNFGVSFLDDALFGIRPDDLVLVGAPSGVGKTQFCVNVALANVTRGKRVHFFALEASEFEVERRLKYQLIADKFYADQARTFLRRPLRFDEWAAGEFTGLISSYEAEATLECEQKLKTLFTFYKSGDFNVSNLIEYFSLVQDETDLVIVDHVHYFDWDDSNDNRALKEIAKAARDLCLMARRPMVLVAHLRKRDRNNPEICAGLDEFHGSSDLAKICTKAVTLAPGGVAEGGGYVTYFRTPKNRESSSATKFVAQLIFDERKGSYEKEYKLGWANSTKFGEIDIARRPSWIGRSSLGAAKAREEVRSHSGGNSSNAEGAPGSSAPPRRIRNYAPGAEND